MSGPSESGSSGANVYGRQKGGHPSSAGAHESHAREGRGGWGWGGGGVGYRESSLLSAPVVVSSFFSSFSTSGADSNRSGAFPHSPVPRAPVPFSPAFDFIPRSPFPFLCMSVCVCLRVSVCIQHCGGLGCQPPHSHLRCSSAASSFLPATSSPQLPAPQLSTPSPQSLIRPLN